MALSRDEEVESWTRESTLCEIARELQAAGLDRVIINAVRRRRQHEGVTKGRLVQIAELLENPELLAILEGTDEEQNPDPDQEV